MQRKILKNVCYLRSVYKYLCSVQSNTSHYILTDVRIRNPNYLPCFLFFNSKYYQKPLETKQVQICFVRPLSKDPSKVEETVKTLKDEKSKKTNIDPATVVPASPPKRSLGKRVWDEIVHYYHGFRLLFLDIKVSARLTKKLLNGEELSRREHKQLVRTTSDLFRLVPFSIFIIVPFMELLLPVFLKFFPQMLPTTFQTSSEKEKKLKANLKMKIETCKFLQDIFDEMASRSKGDAHSHAAKEFATFFEKIRTTGEQASNEDIIKFSKFFEDELTLDNLTRPSLLALCRLLELQPLGTNNFLRFQLRMKLRSLKADDQVIRKESIENLTVSELQAACRARGMRALGMPESRLRSQLQQWLQLSLNEQIPPSLLLLSRALYLPENLPATDQLKATLSSLPVTAATEAKLKISEIEGKVDNKTKLELVKKEEAEIKKEIEEMVQDKMEEMKDVEKKVDAALDMKKEATDKEILIDKAPVLGDKAEAVRTSEKPDAKTKDKEFSKEDLDDLEDALENIANEKKQLITEKAEIEDLKEEMADYKEDIEELKGIVLETSHKEIRQSKAAMRLSKRVNKMVSTMDSLIDELNKEKETLQQKIEDKRSEGISTVLEKDNIIGINELVLAIKRIQKVSDDTRLQQIADVLEKMEVDHDGAVEVKHVLKILELLGKENVKVTAKQMDEIIELLMKEDFLEFEEKLQKHQKRNQEDNLSQGKSEEKQT